MDVYLVTDTHFNPTGASTYCVRPKNFSERLKANWHACVKPDDLVIHGGDVIIHGYEYAKEILDSLPGRKILIMGNHDRPKSETWWMNNGFSFATHSMIFRDVLLTHEPAHSLPKNVKINIHGHCHINRRSWEPLKTWNFLMAMEYTNYTPVKWEKFIAKYNQKYNPRNWNGTEHPIPW